MCVHFVKIPKFVELRVYDLCTSLDVCYIWMKNILQKKSIWKGKNKKEMFSMPAHPLRWRTLYPGQEGSYGQYSKNKEAEGL